MTDDTLLIDILHSIRRYGEELVKPCARFAGLTERNLRRHLAELEAAETQTLRWSEEAAALPTVSKRFEAIRRLRLGLPFTLRPA